MWEFHQTVWLVFFPLYILWNDVITSISLEFRDWVHIWKMTRIMLGIKLTLKVMVTMDDSIHTWLLFFLKKCISLYSINYKLSKLWLWDKYVIDLDSPSRFMIIQDYGIFLTYNILYHSNCQSTYYRYCKLSENHSFKGFKYLYFWYSQWWKYVHETIT